jgi:tetratricopeptide (TPR) repeat protein
MGGSASEADRDREARDAELVEEAIERLLAGDTSGAERILHDVAQRAPRQYQRDTDAPTGELVVRFWDETEFIHFATRNGERLGRTIVWVKSAYPRAYYYLGFLRVKQERPAEAIPFLDAGLELEPRNALLRLEKAKAIGLMGDRAGQLRLAKEVVDLGDEVPGNQRAVAMRSAGFALIEEGELDAAEEWFRRSLELDPDSPVAASELEYIDGLRQGGERAPPETIMTGGQRGRVCTKCNEVLTGKGRVLDVEGRILFLCERCDREPPKKWWQFWK